MNFLLSPPLAELLSISEMAEVPQLLNCWIKLWWNFVLNPAKLLGGPSGKRGKNPSPAPQRAAGLDTCRLWAYWTGGAGAGAEWNVHAVALDDDLPITGHSWPNRQERCLVSNIVGRILFTPPIGWAWSSPNDWSAQGERHCQQTGVGSLRNGLSLWKCIGIDPSPWGLARPHAIPVSLPSSRPHNWLPAISVVCPLSQPQGPPSPQFSPLVLLLSSQTPHCCYSRFTPPYHWFLPLTPQPPLWLCLCLLFPVFTLSRLPVLRNKMQLPLLQIINFPSCLPASGAALTATNGLDMSCPNLHEAAVICCESFCNAFAWEKLLKNKLYCIRLMEANKFHWPFSLRFITVEHRAGARRHPAPSAGPEAQLAHTLAHTVLSLPHSCRALSSLSCSHLPPSLLLSLRFCTSFLLLPSSSTSSTSPHCSQMHVCRERNILSLAQLYAGDKSVPLVEETDAGITVQ